MTNVLHHDTDDGDDGDCGDVYDDEVHHYYMEFFDENYVFALNSTPMTHYYVDYPVDSHQSVVTHVVEDDVAGLCSKLMVWTAMTTYYHWM